MLVLGDGNPVVRISGPWVNRALILANIVVFLFVPAWIDYAFVPAQITYGALPPGYGDASLPQRLVTYMFFHADWLHLGGNLLALWVFGDNVEDSTGHWRYAVFYFLCGILSALIYAAFVDTPKMPLIGASGAISGVMGAYLLLHPRARILVLLLGRIPVLLPAMVVVGLQIIVNVVFALDPTILGVEDEAGVQVIAWWVHVGGFLAGMLLILVLRMPGVPLLQPAPAAGGTVFPRLRRWLVSENAPIEDQEKRWRGWVAFGKTILFIVAVLGIASFFG
jgi:membrane associated rhomboid family serine protease